MAPKQKMVERALKEPRMWRGTVYTPDAQSGKCMVPEDFPADEDLPEIVDLTKHTATYQTASKAGIITSASGMAVEGDEVEDNKDNVNQQALTGDEPTPTGSTAGDGTTPRLGAATGMPGVTGTAAPNQTVKGTPNFDYKTAEREDLIREAELRGMTVTGTGQDGYVKVQDLRTAFAEQEKAQAGG